MVCEQNNFKMSKAHPNSTMLSSKFHTNDSPVLFIGNATQWVLYPPFVKKATDLRVLSRQFVAALWSPAGGCSLGSCLWCLVVFLSLSHVVSWVRYGT